MNCSRGAGALLGGIDVSGSLQTFSPATKTGEESGALFHAGLATLTMMEELRLSNRVLQAYRLSDNYLSKTQDDDVIARLLGCARCAVEQLGLPRLDKRF